MICEDVYQVTYKAAVKCALCAGNSSTGKDERGDEGTHINSFVFSEKIR
jgi:hypothetical protein